MNPMHPAPSALQRPFQINRRRFLRGLGAGIALPALVSMPGVAAASGPVKAAARATTATGAPLRSIFLYFPNGAIPSEWWPAEGAGASPSELSRTLEPLDTVRRHVQILKGIDISPPIPVPTAPATMRAATAPS